MSRNILLCLAFTLISFYLLPVTKIFSAEFDSNQAYQDYLYNYNLYRTSNLDYVSAKNEYLTYKTLTAQTKALETTQKMLIARDEAMRTYLVLIRMKLRETTGIQNYQQNLYYVKLDDELAWLEEHKLKVTSVSSLDDVQTIAKEFENRFPIMAMYAYQSRLAIAAGKVNNFHDQINNQVPLLETKINEMKTGGENVSTLERWLLDSKQKIVRADEKIINANSLALTILANKPESQESSYQESVKSIEEANQYLKETVSNFKEIIREIKYGN